MSSESGPRKGWSPRGRIPNSRASAALFALALSALGFAVGVFLLVIVPMIRSGQGIFAYVHRNTVSIDTRDARLRQPLQVQPFPTPRNDRPELWLTPVATRYFPSADDFASLKSGAATSYDPRGTRRVFALPPFTDALG